MLSFICHGMLREVTISELIIAGWTGRDPLKVQEHVEELAALGVAPPKTIPCFYRAGAALPTTAAVIDCLGAASSGEAEFVLLHLNDGWWVGAGSDHTDRKVEAYSITVSKQMCPKPVAPDLWKLDEVLPHWDSLEISSEVDDGAGFVPYQRGSVAAMRDPSELLDLAAQAGLPLGPGTMIFGGTLPVLGGIRPRRAFRFALHDPVRGTTLSHGYTARWLAD